jgi:homoserine O-acetyltransferase
LFPNFITNLIPVGGDWKATDWMIANTFLQKQILATNPKPLEIARMHAMLCYRTPESFKLRFNRTVNKDLGVFNVESWLMYHGEKLTERFQLQAYKTMNHVLGSIDITRNGKSFEEIVQTIKATIYIFPLSEDQETVRRAAAIGVTINHQTIHSDYGHDAFLMESEKVIPLIHPIFN